jgi:hypothetical protein
MTAPFGHMTAREAKKACKTPGLTVWAGVTGVFSDNLTVQAWTHYHGEIVITIHAKSWPLAVAAFLGWREAWLKENAR